MVGHILDVVAVIKAGIYVGLDVVEHVWVELHVVFVDGAWHQGVGVSAAGVVGGFPETLEVLSQLSRKTNFEIPKYMI